MEEIFSKIKEQSEFLTETELKNWVAPFCNHYNKKIESHAIKLYGSGCAKLSKDAYKEIAKEKIFSALKTFFITKQHWKTDKDLNVYLHVTLKRLAENLYWENSANKRTNIPVCPGCRESGHKVFLQLEGKLWRCPICTSESERLGYDLKNNNIKEQDFVFITEKLRIHKLFSLHSKKGFRCPDEDCGRFIPASLLGEFGIACPYNDCSFFGDIDSLEDMAHPSAKSQRSMVSLNQKLKNNGEESETSLQDLIEGDSVPADVKLSIKQSFAYEYKTLMDVINAQMKFTEKMAGNITKTQKTLMYRAFKEMTEEFPDEMVSYLCHLKQSADVPIQARIFQKFVSLMEDMLPYSIEKYGEISDILSISDPDLNIFTGISEFETYVKSGGIIPNDTIETYTGSRKYKLHGACFLGKVVDIKVGNVSVLDQMKHHSFAEIYTTLPAGTCVTVTHLRIPAHYEMGALVFLQRIRRAIVDKVWLLTKGEKRQVQREAAA